MTVSSDEETLNADNIDLFFTDPRASSTTSCRRARERLRNSFSLVEIQLKKGGTTVPITQNEFTIAALAVDDEGDIQELSIPIVTVLASLAVKGRGNAGIWTALSNGSAVQSLRYESPDDRRDRLETEEKTATKERQRGNERRLVQTLLDSIGDPDTAVDVIAEVAKEWQQLRLPMQDARPIIQEE